MHSVRPGVWRGPIAPFLEFYFHLTKVGPGLFADLEHMVWTILNVLKGQAARDPQVSFQ